MPEDAAARAADGERLTPDRTMPTDCPVLRDAQGTLPAGISRTISSASPTRLLGNRNIIKTSSDEIASMSGR